MMIAYLGRDRSHEREIDPVDLGCGAGQVACFECGGDGDWGKFLGPEMLAEVYPGVDHLDCVDCKGTGRVLVSI